jgi:hypothetical protein
MPPKTHWTADMAAFLVRHYADHKTQWIADQLGIPLTAVYHKAHLTGLKKNRSFLASEDSGRLTGRQGAATRFKPGGEPWNKGAKYQAGGRSKETQFKKGQKSHTWYPIGHERITDEGYRQRKMTDTGVTRRDYINVHWLIWIEANGPIPAGHAVVFKDGDRTHIALDNLELVSRADLMRRNTRHNLPQELNELIHLRAVISRRINKLEKEAA